MIYLTSGDLHPQRPQSYKRMCDRNTDFADSAIYIDSEQKFYTRFHDIALI